MRVYLESHGLHSKTIKKKTSRKNYLITNIPKQKMSASIEEIRKLEQRKRDAHSRFLADLSTRLLPRLFSELGINDYQIEHQFIEPTGNPVRQEVSPDLVVAYRNHSYNLLMVEAKGHMSYSSSIKLEEQLGYLKHFVDSPYGRESLYLLLEKQIPLETISSCGIITAGVYATKHGGFKLYKKDRLR